MIVIHTAACAAAADVTTNGLEHPANYVSILNAIFPTRRNHSLRSSNDSICIYKDRKVDQECR